MSFDPIKFKYTPPLTIVPEYQASTTEAGVATEVTTGTANSRAAALIVKLNEMEATSQYLQEIILQQSQNTSVSIDFTVNPDVSRALTGIYSTSNPSSTITIPMYNKLLDAEIGSMVVDMQLGPNSPFMPSPYQQADLMTVTRAVESQLLANNNYSSFLPTMLRTLKGDAVIFNSWATTTSTYPVMRYDQYKATSPAAIISAEAVDMPNNVHAYMDDYTDRFANAYAGMYKLTAGLNAVEKDINSVINQYVNQPIGDLVRIITLLTSLKSLSHLGSSRELADDLVNFAFVRLQCDLFTALTGVNRIMNIAVAPFKASIGSLSRMTNSISGVAKTVGTMSSGGLKDMIQGNPCSSKPTKAGTKTKIKGMSISGIDSITQGLTSLGAHLDMAQRKIMLKETQMMDNLRRANERLVGKHADCLELLCSLRALDSLISFAMSLASQLGASGPTFQTSSNVISTVLTDINIGAGPTYSLSSQGVVIAAPPNVPTPLQPVINVLARGGLTQLKL